MNKRDSILIACLVNVAILALLMIFTINDPKPTTSPKKETVVQTKKEPEPIVLKAKEPAKPAMKDTGDALLEKHKEEVFVKNETEKTPAEWYTVKSGDSPWKIAKAHDISYNEILKLNQMSEEAAKKLKPGDTLRIR